MGPTQRRILDALRAADEDGLSVVRLASLLGITERAVEASIERLEHRGLVVLTTSASIVWLPERRLNWLRTRANDTQATKKEITRLIRNMAGRDESKLTS